MYCDNLMKCFEKHLESKGIVKVDRFNSEIKYEDITIPMIRDQVHVISEFHIRTLGYTGRMNRRLDNNIGKVVEQYKIHIKRLDRDLKRLKNSNGYSEFEKILSEVGEEYLIRAKKSIKNVYKNNYINLILRSMDRVEMCLGNTYFNNLREGEKIEVIDTGDCCYNMVETDLVYFLSKIKRHGMNVDFNELVMEFCELQSLGSDSLEFILSMLSYPYEFMKCCNRYRDKSKNWTEEEYVLRLNKAMLADGGILI